MANYVIPPYNKGTKAVFDFSGGLNNTNPKHLINQNELTDAKNVILDGSAIEKRKGTEQIGDTIGTDSKILGMGHLKKEAGTNYHLCGYNTDAYYNSSGTWTALSHGTTAGHKMEFITAWDYVYITNGYDIVTKWSGAGAVSDLADFPVAAAGVTQRGHYWAFFKERLITANTDEHPQRVYYSDEGTDTISINNYFDVLGAVTGLGVYKNHLFVFTEDETYRIDGFVFSGAGTEPERLNPLKQGTGCVSHRSIRVVGGMMYFLGREDVYACDGTRVYPIARPKIRETFDGLYQNYFADACAGVLKHRYYLAVKSEGANKNDIILVFDTRSKGWTYFTDLNPSCFVEYPNGSGEYELFYGDDDDALGKVWRMDQGFSDGAPTDVVLNGSMETGILGNVPTSWAENYDGTTTGTVKKSANAAILGSHSIECIRTGGDSYMDAHQDCTVTASTTYQWQAWIKTSYQGNDEDIYMHVIKSTSPFTVYATFQIGSKDNSSGRYYYGTVDVPAGITGISVGLVLNSGMDTTPVYLDDVRLQEEGSAITANVETGVLHYGTPYRNKKFKKTFVSAKPSTDYTLDDTNYNLTVGYAAGFEDSFSTTTIDLDADTDKVEKYLRTSVKSKHIRYQFYNSGKNQPFKLYGFTSVYIPLESLR